MCCVLFRSLAVHFLHRLSACTSTLQMKRIARAWKTLPGRAGLLACWKVGPILGVSMGASRGYQIGSPLICTIGCFDWRAVSMVRDVVKLKGGRIRGSSESRRSASWGPFNKFPTSLWRRCNSPSGPAFHLQVLVGNPLLVLAVLPVLPMHLQLYGCISGQCQDLCGCGGLVNGRSCPSRPLSFLVSIFHFGARLALLPRGRKVRALLSQGDPAPGDILSFSPSFLFSFLHHLVHR